MREAELADGTILEFPDETTDEVIQSTVKKLIASQGTSQPQAQVEQDPQEEQGFIDAATDTAGFLGKSMGAQSLAGITGLTEFAITGARNTLSDALIGAGFEDAANFLKSDSTAADAANKAIQDTLSVFSPKLPDSERVQGQLQDVGGAIETATDAVQVPLSGIAGLTELATGQGIEQASQTVSDVQGKGLSQTMGDRVLEEGGSAEAATLAYMTPQVVESVIGTKGAAKAVDTVKDAASGAKRVGQAVNDIRETIPSRLPNAKQIKNSEVRQAIQDGSKYFVDKKIDAKTGRIVDDAVAKKALKQNITDETVAFTKRLDAGTNKQAKRILDRGAEILEFGEKQGGRPNAIIGERVMKRFDTVLDANNKAGKDISKAVNNIKDTSINIADDIDAFDDNLASLDIKRIDGVLDFKGSQVEGDSVIPLIKMMDKRLNKGFNAKSLHQEKQFIANKLYNKAGEAKVKGGTLSPQGVKILEQLRDGFNQKLRDASPDYALANDKYSETITSLNDFKKIMGQKKFNPYSDRIDNTIGNESRKLLTQYRSGQDMQEAIKNLNNISAKYGGKYDDDIVELTRFYDNFEREFKSFAQGSFPAQTRDAAKDAAGVAFDAATGAPIQAAKGAARVGGKLFKKDPTERTKIKALKDLLKENK